MNLKEIDNIKTLDQAKDLPEGNYLVSYNPIGLGDKLGSMRIDVLQITCNGIGILGGCFLFDRNPKSPIVEIYEII